MRIRFTVTAFVDRRQRLGVTGSRAELGDWQKVVPLTPVRVASSDRDASCWAAAVEIPHLSDFEYKFVTWAGLEPVPQTEETEPCRGVQVPALPDEQPLTLPRSPLQFEGSGSRSNRQFLMKARPAGTLSEASVSPLVHIYDEEVNLIDADEYALPVALFWHYNAEQQNETSHTMRYYLHYKRCGQIHYDRVTDRILLGTCPRSARDLVQLRDHEGVTDVVNFQESEDARENFIDPLVPREERSVELIAELCDGLGVNYTWLPTKDLCSAARGRTVAQAALILTALLAREGSVLYVHCNAGVGRSTAGVAGQMIFCGGHSLRRVNLFLAARRPVAFFDEPALRRGGLDYSRRFRDLHLKF